MSNHKNVTVKSNYNLMHDVVSVFIHMERTEKSRYIETLSHVISYRWIFYLIIFCEEWVLKY